MLSLIVNGNFSHMSMFLIFTIRLIGFRFKDWFNATFHFSLFKLRLFYIIHTVISLTRLFWAA